MTKNLGHLVLAIYLIFVGATGLLSLNIAYVGPILAIAAGVLLLMGK
jgi:hypothetical protein